LGLTYPERWVMDSSVQRPESGTRGRGLEWTVCVYSVSLTNLEWLSEHGVPDWAWMQELMKEERMETHLKFSWSNNEQAPFEREWRDRLDRPANILERVDEWTDIRMVGRCCIATLPVRHLCRMVITMCGIQFPGFQPSATVTILSDITHSAFYTWQASKRVFLNLSCSHIFFFAIGLFETHFR